MKSLPLSSPLSIAFPNLALIGKGEESGETLLDAASERQINRQLYLFKPLASFQLFCSSPDHTWDASPSLEPGKGNITSAGS